MHSSVSKFKKLIGISVAAIVALPLLAITPASAAGNFPGYESSNAIRWAANGAPIGDIVYQFIDRDDTTKKIDAPFPINFFGQRFPALCLSTNGLVFPIASTSSNCSASYDKSVEVLAMNSRASAIAALALDLDPSEELWNPQLSSTSELTLTSLSSVSNVVTFTTNEPHGFKVGDYLRTSWDPNFLQDQTGKYIGNVTVESVPSATTYTATIDTNSGDNVIPDGTYSPAAGDRTVVYREIFWERTDSLSISGTTLTVNTSGSNELGVGRKFTFTNTGIALLDQAKLTVASRIAEDEFTVTVPAGISDLDPATSGNQTSIDSWIDVPYVIERDDIGAIQQVYFGETTVNGKQAYALTWYRVAGNDYSTNGVNGGRFPAVNPRNLSNSVQLVIIKENTGSHAAGWDFNYEYNIGHAKDPGDGYKSTNPATSCGLSEIATCRWGMGVAEYRGGLVVSTMSSDGTSVIVNTATPHGLKVGQQIEIYDMDSLGELSGRNSVTEIIDSNSFKYAAPDGYTPVAEQSVGLNATVGSAVAYELFPDTSSTQLSDAGGSTALVKNSLNSSVLGRYTFSMVGGQVVGFKKPSMGAGVTYAEELAATGGNEMIAFSLALLAFSAGVGLIAFSRRHRRISH